MFKDIRMEHRKGFQPERVDTATRIKMFGWDKFHKVDGPEEPVAYVIRRLQIAP